MISKSDLYAIKAYVKDNLGWIVVIILAFLMLNTCNKSDNSAVLKEREKTIKSLEQSRASFIKKNAELQKLVIVNKKQIEKAEKKITSLEKENARLEAKGNKQIAKLKDNDIKEWKNYYQDITKLGEKDISIIDTSLKFTRKPLIIIANKIIKGEVATAKLEIANKIIAETRIVANEHKDNYNTEVEKNENLLNVIETDSLIKVNLNENVKDLKEDLKKAKKPKLVPILIAVGVGVIGGALISK